MILLHFSLVSVFIATDGYLPCQPFCPHAILIIANRIKNLVFGFTNPRYCSGTIANLVGRGGFAVRFHVRHDIYLPAQSKLNKRPSTAIPWVSSQKSDSVASHLESSRFVGLLLHTALRDFLINNARTQRIINFIKRNIYNRVSVVNCPTGTGYRITTIATIR